MEDPDRPALVHARTQNHTQEAPSDTTRRPTGGSRFNHTRLHSALDYRPPAEAETEYDGQINPTGRPLVGEPAR